MICARVRQKGRFVRKTIMHICQMQNTNVKQIHWHVWCMVCGSVLSLNEVDCKLFCHVFLFCLWALNDSLSMFYCCSNAVGYYFCFLSVVLLKCFSSASLLDIGLSIKLLNILCNFVNYSFESMNFGFHYIVFSFLLQCQIWLCVLYHYYQRH